MLCFHHFEFLIVKILEALELILLKMDALKALLRILGMDMEIRYRTTSFGIYRFIMLDRLRL